MPDSSKEVRYEITGDAAGFTKAMEASAAAVTKSMGAAGTAVTTATDQINAQFKKIGDTVGMVSKFMLGFTAVLAGGGALKKFISDANEWNGTAGRMANQLGITTQQASVLNVALARLGIDSETYTGASQKLSKQVQTNAQAFEVLGVKVRDTAGNYRPVTEVMGEVNTKLAAIKNPIEQNIAGMQVYGKGWSDMRGILRLTSEQMETAELRARQLNLIVGPEGVAMSKQYSTQMRELGLVGKSLEVQFGNALLPVFTKVGAFMAGEGPQMGRVFALVLEGIGFAAASTWLALKDMGDGLGALAAQAAALLSGDIAGFKAIGKSRDEESAKNQASYEKLKAGFGKPISGAPMPDAPDINGGPKYKFKEKAEGPDKADKSRMGGWEAELAETKLGEQEKQNALGSFQQFSLAQEADYWRAHLALTTTGTQENIAVRRKLADVQLSINKATFAAEVAGLQTQAAAWKNNTDEHLAILAKEAELMRQRHGAESKEFEEVQKKIVETKRQAAEQLVQIDAIGLQKIRTAQLAELGIREEAARLDLQLGIINQAQMLAQQRLFENERNAVAATALQDKLALLSADPDRNPVLLAQLQAEIEALEQQHQLRLAQIRTQAAAENSKEITGTLGSIQSSWASLISRMFQGTLTIGGFVKGIFKSVADAVIQTLAGMAAKWMIQQATMLIYGKAVAVSTIAGEAAKAGAGGVASMAAAPWPIDMAAPAFGAAMAAAAMSFAPAVSASEGYDVPSGVNPIAQIHSREMVLPAKHADVIRGLSDGTSPAAGGGSSINIYGSPDDSIKLKDLARVLKKMNRNFEFVR